MRRIKSARCLGMALLLAVLFPQAGRADDSKEMEKLKRKVDAQEVLIQKQQETIQQLAEKVSQMENKLGGPPAPAAPRVSQPPVEQKRVSLEGEELPALPPEVVQKGPLIPFPVKLGGYLDVGYVDPDGRGAVSTGALQINSRGDNLSNVGLDGDSSFLVNEINLDLLANPTPRMEVVTNVALLPRKLTVTASGGTPSTDSAEVNLAYVAYEPFAHGSNHPLIDNFFGDLKLSLGKFESPIGIEYRINKSPDRANISRSMMSIYWTGTPVGVKARGKLFQDDFKQFRNSTVTYNLAVTNAEPWLNEFVDGDRATNSRRTVMGRLSYGLDLLGGFFETGLSLAQGARINQGDNHTLADSVDIDARLERGPLTLRAEYDSSNLDRPRTGGSAATFSHYYLEGFYELKRPVWVPGWLPLTSLTPYYRFDARDLNLTPATGAATAVQVDRHTFALRYLLKPGRMLKTEYQIVSEAEGADFDDNSFLASFVQQF